MTVVLGTGFMLLLAGRAAGLVTIEKERDCWISLLSTPMTGGEIMRENARQSLRRSLGPDHPDRASGCSADFSTSATC